MESFLYVYRVLRDKLKTPDIMSEMKPKTKTVTFNFDANGILLSGVSQAYQDMLDEGLDSEEALWCIMEDAIVQYHLWKKYPKWTPSVISGKDGEYEIELEKLPEWCWRK